MRVRRTLVVVCAAGLALAPLPALAQFFTISPTSGPPGTVVTADGCGWGASTTVTITFDKAVRATPTSDPAGCIVKVTFTVPNAPRGAHVVEACDAPAAAPPTCLAQDFIVTPDFSISPASGRSGTSVNGNGCGWTASVGITINFDGASVKTTTADGVGCFATTFTVPSKSPGPYTVQACEPGVCLSQSFTVLASPALALKPGSGRVGTMVAASGCGWDPNAATEIFFDKQSVKSATTNSDGCIPAGTNFTVPARAGAKYQVKACQAACALSATANFTVIGPELILDPESGLPAIVVGATGCNWGASTALEIFFDGKSVTTTKTDAKGCIVAGSNFTVPDKPPGTYPVKGCQSRCQVSALRNFDVLTPPGPSPLPPAPPPPPGPKDLALDRPSTEPGGEAVATGKGCDPNSEVRLSTGGRPLGTTRADADGDFEAPLVMPAELGVGRFEIKAECGPTLLTNIDLVLASQQGSPAAVFVLFLFFLLDALRRLVRRSRAAPRLR